MQGDDGIPPAKVLQRGCNKDLFLQGATWMYEAIVGPTFQLILKEAVKIPAIDRLVNQTDLVTLTDHHLCCCHSWLI